MNSVLPIFIASIITFFFYFPTPAKAETKTSDFLELSRKSQDSYFQIAIGMASTVATQVEPKIAKCIDDWYFKDEETRRRRGDEIRKVMQSVPGYHPDGVLLAVIQRACGKFGK